MCSSNYFYKDLFFIIQVRQKNKTYHEDNLQTSVVDRNEIGENVQISEAKVQHSRITVCTISKSIFYLQNNTNDVKYNFLYSNSK